MFFNIVFSIALTAGVYSYTSCFNYSIGQWYIGGNNEVAFFYLLNNALIGHIETSGYLNNAYEPMQRNGERFIGNEHYRGICPQRSFKNNLFDHFWASIGVNPNSHNLKLLSYSEE